jgi:hypothetical protein
MNRRPAGDMDEKPSKKTGSTEKLYIKNVCFSGFKLLIFFSAPLGRWGLGMAPTPPISGSLFPNFRTVSPD